ncbi:hypothetical protein CHUAL_007977 [Chamberlinius hualienensis]
MGNRKEKRLKNKISKLKAYLQLAKSNDQDRMERKQQQQQLKRSSSQLNNEDPKRKKIHNSSNWPEYMLPQTSKAAPIIELDISDLVSLKAELTARKPKLRIIPILNLTKIGKESRFVLDGESNMDTVNPLFIGDIQKMILRGILGVKGPPSLEWCDFIRFPIISHVVVIHVNNFSSNTYSKHFESMTNTQKLFDHVLLFHPPSVYGNCVLNELFWVPMTMLSLRLFNTGLREAIDSGRIIEGKPCKNIFNVAENGTKSVKNKVLEEISSNKKTKMVLEGLASMEEKEMDKCTKVTLLCSRQQMMKENCPFPVGVPVPTKDQYISVTDDSPLFGLDCEMCFTERRLHELTRVSIVNEKCELIYDELVKPKYKIRDYLTEFSGITKAMLKDVTKTLEDVQEDIRKLLPPDAILVGQSLASDLKALNMYHPYIIDTSIIYNITGSAKRKTKLKNLEEIQQHGAEGHDSFEDSVAALKLVLIKLQKGLQFGDVRWNSTLSKINLDKEPILQTPKNKYKWLASENPPDDDTVSKIEEYNREKYRTNYCISFFKQLQRNNKNALLVNVNEKNTMFSETLKITQESSNVDNVKVKSDRKLVKKLVKKAANYNFSLGHIEYKGNSNDSDNSHIINLDNSLSEIYRSCGINSLLIVLGEDEDVNNYKRGSMK